MLDLNAIFARSLKKTHPRMNQVSGSLSIVVTNNATEHISITDWPLC
jgi:hypothetical protein